MHVLCISLTEKRNEGARTIQLAKVVNALQRQGVFVTVITSCNEKLKSIDPSLGKVIYMPDTLKNSPGFIKKTSKLLNSLIYFISPKHKNTIKRSTKVALDVVKNNKVDLIFSSSHPVDSHVVGLCLKNKTGLPWVASFSDPRPNDMLPPPYGNKKIKLKTFFEKRIIRNFLTAPDGIHMPTDICGSLTENYFRLDLKRKMFFIPPIGEQEYDFKANKNNNWLVHVGRIKRRITPAFLEALRDYKAMYPQHIEGIVCVGIYDKLVLRLARSLKTGHLVKTVPRVSHNEALDIIAEGKAVVVLEAEMEFSHALPSKFAEASFSGKPILAITPRKSKIRDYLEQYGGGVAVTQNKEEIIQGLTELFNSSEHKTQKTLDDQVKLSSNFTYKTVGEQYCQMFSSVRAQACKHEESNGGA